MLSTWYGLRRFSDLSKRTAADKVLPDKAFDIAKNPKWDGHQRGFASMVYTFVNKTFSGCGVESEIMPNQELAEAIHKLVIRKFEK